MRIISGKFRGKKLNQPIDKNTRPLKDMTKESIFNLLLHSKNYSINFEKLKVLDLFSGSGSFGLECLSREASNVFFVENDKEALENLKKNIRSLRLEDQSKIFDKDINKIDENFFQKIKFDLIFLDPPYLEKKYDKILNIIKKCNILNKNHILILHKEKGSDHKSLSNLNVIENRVYGRSQIFFLKLF